MKQTGAAEKKAVLGLSGGVDSTAAALLLQQNGFAVTGVFFDVLGNQEEEQAKAELAAKELGIPFICRRVAEEFQEKVIAPFGRAYERGETPNPCIICNPTVKFQILLAEADRLGAPFVATGHYARVEEDRETGLSFLCRGVSEKKDQSYMLYRLPQTVLRRLLLPLGNAVSKEDTRRLVRHEGIGNADRKDSQEICFIKEGDYAGYLTERGWGGNAPGNFVDEDGTKLGTHRGLLYYTVGQRKGLGVTFGKPMFVVALHAEKNQVVLGDEKQLLAQTVHVKDCRFSCYEDGTGSFPTPLLGETLLAKIRYGAPLAQAVVAGQKDGRLTVEFQEPQRAPAPGQSLVLYREQRLVGGGFICK